MIEELRDPAAVDAAARAPVAVIYKHSPICGASRRAASEVARFTEAHPDVPVFRVDVVHQRPLSRALAERFGVRHESPQVIVLHAGRVAWSGSHWEVEAKALDAQVRAGGT